MVKCRDDEVMLRRANKQVSATHDIIQI